MFVACIASGRRFALIVNDLVDVSLMPLTGREAPNVAVGDESSKQFILVINM
jgi:hypothetical protein